MIDIRELRNDPDGFVAARRPQGRRRAARELLEVDAAWRARDDDRRGAARGRQAEGQADARAARGAEAAQGAAAGGRGRARRSSRSARVALLDRVPNPPAEDVPDGGEDDWELVRESASRRPSTSRRATTSTSARARLDRPGARREGLRLALRLPRRRPRAARARALPLGARPRRRAGTRPGAAAGARPRGGDVRHRLPPDRRGQHLRARARRALPRRARPRCRSPRYHAHELPRRPAAPLRRLLALLPPRGGRRRQGHARHVPRAPVRQGRDVRLLRRPRRARRSTSACSRSRRARRRSSACRTA